MAKTKQKNDEMSDEELALEAAEDLAVAHGCAKKIFGDTVGPGVALFIFDHMTVEDENLTELTSEIENAKETALEIFGEASPELVLEVYERLFGDLDE